MTLDLTDVRRELERERAANAKLREAAKYILTVRFCESPLCKRGEDDEFCGWHRLDGALRDTAPKGEL